MAKKRMLDTRFWSDTYISDLDPLEKLLFLYLISNQYTNICGIYEIPIKQIALDTGIDRNNLEKVLLPRFEEVGKIFYIDGWVYVKNFLKHQKASGNVQTGIENGLKEVPEEIIAKIKVIKDTGGTQGGHSLKLKLESELKLEPEGAAANAAHPEVTEVINEFKKINPTINFGNKTERQAVKDLIKHFGIEKLRQIVAAAIIIYGQPYAPVITTPYQLKVNYSKLQAFYQAEGQIKNKSQVYDFTK